MQADIKYLKLTLKVLKYLPTNLPNILSDSASCSKNVFQIFKMFQNYVLLQVIGFVLKKQYNTNTPFWQCVFISYSI
ncbi:hypothetical protein QTP88_005142 [Uroleucon formosanum]